MHVIGIFFESYSEVFGAMRGVVKRVRGRKSRLRKVILRTMCGESDLGRAILLFRIGQIFSGAFVQNFDQLGKGGGAILGGLLDFAPVGF